MWSDIASLLVGPSDLCVRQAGSAQLHLPVLRPLTFKHPALEQVQNARHSTSKLACVLQIVDVIEQETVWGRVTVLDSGGQGVIKTKLRSKP